MVNSTEWNGNDTNLQIAKWITGAAAMTVSLQGDQPVQINSIFISIYRWDTAIIILFISDDYTVVIYI